MCTKPRCEYIDKPFDEEQEDRALAPGLELELRSDGRRKGGTEGRPKKQETEVVAVINVIIKHIILSHLSRMSSQCFHGKNLSLYNSPVHIGHNVVG